MGGRPVSQRAHTSQVNGTAPPPPELPGACQGENGRLLRLIHRNLLRSAVYSVSSLVTPEYLFIGEPSLS